MVSLQSPWVNVLAAVVGGIALGTGIGRMVIGFTIGAGVWTVIGLIILWWALSDRRKFRRGTPESETDGSRTVE
jgi:hypothetical protein